MRGRGQYRAESDRFSFAVEEALRDLGIKCWAFARILSENYEGLERGKMEDYIYSLISIGKGATPASKYFFPVCEELGLNPRDFYPAGGRYDKRIEAWERSRA